MSAKKMDQDEQARLEAIHRVIAFYMYGHRERQHWLRDIDPIDEYYKAQYLYKLVQFINQTSSSVVPFINAHPRLAEVIDMVYNIFDRAYFHKIDYPSCSDLECFDEAERYYFDKKNLDHSLYLSFLSQTE